MNNKMLCIKKMIDEGLLEEFTEYIVDNRLDVENHLNEANMNSSAAIIFRILEDSVKNEKLLLLDYEWQILPHEYIKIICVSELTGKHTFTYNF